MDGVVDEVIHRERTSPHHPFFKRFSNLTIGPTGGDVPFRLLNHLMLKGGVRVSVDLQVTNAFQAKELIAREKIQFNGYIAR